MPMTITYKKGTDGEALLVSRYHDLVAEAGEYRNNTTPAAKAYAERLDNAINRVVEALGYVPE